MSEESQVVESNEEPQIEESEVSGEEVEALEAAAQEQAKEQLVRKLKLKIDGKEIDEELPFDLSPKHAEWMKNQLQLAKVSQMRMQDAANAKKHSQAMEDEVREFLLGLKNNPREILNDKRLGIDLKKLAMDVMNEELEEATKSPEQKDKERLESERAKLEARVKEMEDAKSKAEQDKIENELARQYEDGVISSIKSNGLQADPRVIRRYADAMRAGLKFNIQLTPDEIGPLIKKQLYEEAKFYAGQLNDDDLDDFLGKDRISRVRKSMIDKLRKKLPTKKVEDTGEKELKGDIGVAQKSKYKNSKDFFKALKLKGY